MAAFSRSQKPRSTTVAILLAGGLALSYQLGQLFVSPPQQGPRAHQTLRRAESEGEGDGGGFMSFLNVEQEIELSPEEYAIALQEEIEAQRKRYYIGGVVKPNNLVVPWKPVDEKELERDARKQLKKNGITDPAGAAVGAEDADSRIDVMIVGEQDVQVEWTSGEPGTKVGYIVERKRPQDNNFVEIASYETEGSSYLLIQNYAGHEYTFTDLIVAPGPYTYRILVRFRSGEVKVIDQKDITVPPLSGVDSLAALAVLLVVVVFFFVSGYLRDTPVV